MYNVFALPLVDAKRCSNKYNKEEVIHMAVIDVSAFREIEAQKLITGRPHPIYDLIIWNYTPKCQYDNAWNEVTLQARGLVTKPDGTIVARPLRKFFSMEQYKYEIPDEPFTVGEKVDGYLGVLFQVDGVPHITTRGSFTSEMAQRGEVILHKKYADFAFNPAYTYLFEIIYPEGRLVVNYGDTEDLILLAVIETESGGEIDIHSQSWPFPVAKRYDGLTDFSKLKELYEENREGFVVHFQSGLRIKVKFTEYQRLHSLFFFCTNRAIWKYLKDNTPMAHLLEKIPDELYAWIKSISRDLATQYASLHRRTHETYKKITQEAAIPTPMVIGETVSYLQLERIRKTMHRHLDSQFKLYPDLEPFLNIVHDYRSDKGKSLLQEAIWDALYPTEVKQPEWAISTEGQEEDAG
jgi:RNA ligase